MMRVDGTMAFVTCVMMVAGAAVVLAQPDPASTESAVLRIVERSMRLACPEEAQAAEKSAAFPDAPESLVAIKRIIGRTRRLVQAEPPQPNTRTRGRDAYDAAWQLAILMHNRSTDQATRRELVSTWDLSLADDDIVSVQLHALEWIWAPEFLTERVWVLFEQSRSPRLVAALGRIVARHGSPEDVTRLWRRWDATDDPELKAIISACAAWWDCYHGESDCPKIGPKQVLPWR